MYNDTHLNVLISYAYLYEQKPFMDYVKEQTTNGTVNLMIDSGAFTKHNSKSAMTHINVEDYSKFLQEWKNYCEKYVMLDVIGNRAQSVSNYEYMLDCGLNPMFVATIYDNDFEYINKTLKRTPDICVAGGATCKSLWMIKRFQDVYRKTNGKAQIHGLGYYTFPNMLRLNLRSIDSSSWKTAAARFGQSVIFSEQEKRTYRINWRKIFEGKRKFSNNVKELFRDNGVLAQTYFQKENHTCENSIEFFINIISNVKLQKYCKKHGLHYFFAVGALSDLKKVVFVSNNLNTITYKSFIEKFGKGSGK